jgi:hypothetical protein
MDKSNEAKINLESKLKFGFHGTTHEAVFKNDGSHSYELKSDILERKTNAKGLSFVYNLNANAVPSESAPD